MRISYLVMASSLIALAACGGEPAETSAPEVAPTAPASETETPIPAEISTPIETEIATPDEADYFVPGGIYALNEGACAAMGGEDGQVEFQGKTTSYCKMLGYPASYQCGDDLIITIGGAPTDFRMHISGEDAFYPIKLERIETEAKWTGAHGTLITQIEGNMETGYTFIRNGTEVVCQFYNHN